MRKRKFYLIIMVALIVLALAQYHYIRRDINKNTINILDGSYAMFTQVGVIDAVGHKLHGTGAQEGFVAYGPYIALKEGNYDLTYSLVLNNTDPAADPERNIGRCDVNFVGSPDSNKIINLKIKDFKRGNRCKVNLKFSVPLGNPQTEFRVYQNYGFSLSLVGLQLHPVFKELFFSRESKWLKFNVKVIVCVIALFLTFFLLKVFIVSKYKLAIAVFIMFLVFMEMWCFYRDQLLPVIPGAKMFTQVGVINEKTGEIRGVGAQNGFLAFGPYYPLAEGNYVVTYKIQLNNRAPGDNPDKEVGVADVNIVGFENSNVTKGIKIKDFDNKNLARVVMKFKVPQGNPQMEYRVFQYGGNDLSIKSIRFHPTAAHYLKKYYKMHLDFIGIAILAALVMFPLRVNIGKEKKQKGLANLYTWWLRKKRQIKSNYKKVISILLLLLLSEILWWQISSSTNILGGRFSSQISQFHDGRISNEGKEGFLVYGPYISLKPGKYRVQFTMSINESLRLSGEDKAIGYVDVFSAQAPNVYLSRGIRSGEFKSKNPNRISVSFTVPPGFPQLEFRIFTFKGYNLTLEKYKLHSLFLSDFFFLGNALIFFCLWVITLWMYFKKNNDLLPVSRKVHIALICTIAGICLALVYQWLMRKVAGYPYPYGTLLFDPIGRFGDFSMTHSCIKRFLSGENPYLGSYSPPYFPFMFVALLPFGLMNIKMGILWYCVVLSLFFFYVMFKTFRFKKGLSLTNSWAFAALFTLTSYPLLFVLDRGNSEGMVFVFLCFFVYLYVNRKYILSSLPLAMAIGMKLYPVVFLVLFLSEKKYKEFFYGIFFAAIALLAPFLFMKEPLSVSLGGFLKGINDFNMLYTNNHLGIFDILFNHSLFNVVKAVNTLYWFIADFGFVVRFYSFAVVGIFVVLAAYVIFYEKILWRKMTILCIAMISFPHVSFDYTLINMYIPFLLFFMTKEKSYSMNVLFSFLFAVLLIPKSYFMIDGKINLATFLNPLIMFLMIAFIIYEGIKNRTAGGETQ